MDGNAPSSFLDSLKTILDESEYPEVSFRRLKKGGYVVCFEVDGNVMHATGPDIQTALTKLAERRKEAGV